MNGDWPGGRDFFSSSLFHEFESSLFREFGLSWEFCKNSDTNLEHSHILATTKKINSIPAKTSTV